MTCSRLRSAPGAIDFEVLRPQDVGEEGWEDLHFNALNTLAPTASDPSFSVGVLLLAFGCELEQLQQACLKTLGRLLVAGVGSAPSASVST
mmetsp:Transcript_99120/g.319463  ORF Transcript_99120/g.319463 Transcript_99120/m.319463 type:complete len:91 (-) Transcript_99120:194-466(-)